MMGMPARNYLPDLETDDANSLNAYQWKYASFYNRIRDRVYRVWRPAEATKRHDPMGYQVMHQSRQTDIRVTFGRSGHVVEIVLENPSGAFYLDDEAIRAFQMASPFINPPAALFRGEQTFTDSFGFVYGVRRQELDFNWRPY